MLDISKDDITANPGSPFGPIDPWAPVSPYVHKTAEFRSESEYDYSRSSNSISILLLKPPPLLINSRKKRQLWERDRLVLNSKVLTALSFAFVASFSNLKLWKWKRWLVLSGLHTIKKQQKKKKQKTKNKKQKNKNKNKNKNKTKQKTKQNKTKQFEFANTSYMANICLSCKGRFTNI